LLESAWSLAAKAAVEGDGREGETRRKLLDDRAAARVVTEVGGRVKYAASDDDPASKLRGVLADNLQPASSSLAALLLLLLAACTPASPVARRLSRLPSADSNHSSSAAGARTEGALCCCFCSVRRSSAPVGMA